MPITRQNPNTLDNAGTAFGGASYPADAPNPNPNPAQGVADAFAPYMGAIQSGAQLQSDLLQQQLGQAGAMTNFDIGQAQTGANFSLQGLGLSREQLGLQQNELQNQQQALSGQYGLTQQMFGLQGQQLGLQGQGIDLSQQLNDISKAQEQFQYPLSQQSRSGAAAARGATSTVGNQNEYDRLSFAHSQALQRLGIADRQLDLQRAGLGVSQQELGVTQAEAALGYKTQSAALADSQKGLDIMSKRLNLQESQINSQLNATIQRLGMQGVITADNIKQAIAQVDAGQFSQLAPFLDAIMQAGQLPVTGQGKSASIGGNSPSGLNAVNIAQSFVGIPYSYGGTDPKTGLDCSGLVQDVYSKMGINLPRTSEQQATVGMAIPTDNRSAWQPGDLIFYNVPGEGTSSHVGIYIGNGQQIDAPHPGTDVGVHQVYNYPISTVRRVTG